MSLLLWQPLYCVFTTGTLRSKTILKLTHPSGSSHCSLFLPGVFSWFRLGGQSDVFLSLFILKPHCQLQWSVKLPCALGFSVFVLNSSNLSLSLGRETLVKHTVAHLGRLSHFQTECKIGI